MSAGGTGAATRPSAPTAPTAPTTPGYTIAPSGGGADAAAIRAVRAYVRAVDSGDGARVCALYAPGALAPLKLPVNRGGCADSLSASIGYSSPGGFPALTGIRITGPPTVKVAGSGARVTVSVQESFADHRRLPAEDDVVYLTRTGGRWLIAKPSLTLYRAIGVADIRPRVLAPPG